jgi:hypothetical protein
VFLWVKGVLAADQAVAAALGGLALLVLVPDLFSNDD